MIVTLRGCVDACGRSACDEDYNCTLNLVGLDVMEVALNSQFDENLGECYPSVTYPVECIFIKEVRIGWAALSDALQAAASEHGGVNKYVFRLENAESEIVIREAEGIGGAVAAEGPSAVVFDRIALFGEGSCDFCDRTLDDVRLTLRIICADGHELANIVLCPSGSDILSGAPECPEGEAWNGEECVPV